MRMHSRVRPISILTNPIKVRRTRAGNVLFADRVDTLYSTVVGEGRFTVNMFFMLNSNQLERADPVSSKVGVRKSLCKVTWMFRARSKASHDEPQPCPSKLSAQPKTLSFLLFSSTHKTSQRCHPHHQGTQVARARHHANQNHQEDSAGKTRARAQTTASAAISTTATAMMRLVALHHPVIATDIGIVRLDATATETATVPDRRDETTVIDTEMEVTGDVHLDVMEVEMRGKRREKRTSPKVTKRRRRSQNLSLLPVVRSP